MYRSRRAGVGRSLKAILAGCLALVAFSLLEQGKATAAIIDQGTTAPGRPSAQQMGVAASPLRPQTASSSAWLTPERIKDAKPFGRTLPKESFDVKPFSAEAGISAATGGFTPISASGSPERIQGRLFMLFGEDTYTCSATVVESAKKNVVFTAGHCLAEGAKGPWATKVVFIPGYANGVEPFGRFTADRWFVPQRWEDFADNSYDIGIITLEETIEHLGARKLAFDLSPKINKTKPRQYTLYGYPQMPEDLYDGETLQGCKVEFDRFDATTPNTLPYPMAVKPCLMKQGSSGGGWITLGNYLSSVTSYGRCDGTADLCSSIFGPVFSNAARNLYVHKNAKEGIDVGGSYAPTVKMVKGPPKVLRKRNVSIRVTGKFATLPGFYYTVDKKKPKYLSGKVRMTGLRPGKHKIRIQAVDQLGKKSKRIITRNFRVVLKRR